MSNRQTSYGKCFYCGKAYTRRGISRHLKACPARKEAHAQEKGKEFRLLQVKLWGKYAPYFWMNIEMAAKDTLEDLDYFIRGIWVECCAHLSQFKINGVYYTATPTPDFGFGFGPTIEEESIDTPLWKAVRPRDEFDYEYDFGTTTDIELRIIDERYGVPPKDGVKVMARNYLPEIECLECGQQATQLYVWDGYPPKPYCDQHPEERNEYLEGFLPVVNSPRMGDCGYTGPYDEEYVFEEIYTPEE